MVPSPLRVPQWAWAQFVQRMLSLLGLARLKRAANSNSQRAQRDKARILAAAERFAFDFLTDPASQGLAILLPSTLDHILPRELPNLRRQKPVPSLVRLASDYYHALDRARSKRGVFRARNPAHRRLTLVELFPDTPKPWLEKRRTPEQAALAVAAVKHSLGVKTVRRLVHHMPKSEKDRLAWERRAPLDLEILAEIRKAVRTRP